jgi:hypothetical protein
MQSVPSDRGYRFRKRRKKSGGNAFFCGQVALMADPSDFKRATLRDCIEGRLKPRRKSSIPCHTQAFHDNIRV